MSGLVARTGFAGALRHRDLRLLLGANLISGIGSWAYNVALLAFVFEQTRSLAWVGAVGVARFVPALVLSPVAGAIADRHERRLVLLVSDVLSGLLMVGLALAALAGADAWIALVLAALTSGVGAAYGPVDNAMVPNLVPEEDLAAANALNGTIENLVTLVGPAIGAVLVAVGSVAVTFGVNAATFLVSAVLVLAIRARGDAGVVEDEARPGFADGLRAIGSSPVVVAAVGFSVLASLVYGTETVLFVSLGEDRLGLGPEGFGWLLAGCALGGVLIAPAINGLSESRRLGTILLVGMLAYCVPTVLHVWITDPVAGTAVQVVRGAGTLVVDTLAVVALQRAVSDHVAARVFGVFMALVLGGMVLGAAVTPILVSAVGLDGALWLTGPGLAALCLLAWPALRRMDAQAAARGAELAPTVAVLRRVGPFAAASRLALERLAAAARAQTAGAGSEIIREGDAADAFYVLTGGSVVVTVGGATVRTLAAGDFFGEVGLLSRSPRTATVTARERCRLLRIDGPAFLSGLAAPGPARLIGDAATARLAYTHPSRPAPAVPA